MRYLIVLLFLVGCKEVNEKPWENDPLAEPIKMYTMGPDDLKVYEFRPQTDPNVQCVFVVGWRKGGLDCWYRDIIN